MVLTLRLPLSMLLARLQYLLQMASKSTCRMILRSFALDTKKLYCHSERVSADRLTVFDGWYTLVLFFLFLHQ